MDVSNQAGTIDEAGMASLRAAKKAMRQDITKRLRNLSPEVVFDQSERAVEKLLSMQEYKSAQRLSVYLSMDGKEIQTRRIVWDALSNGKTVFVPYTYKAIEPAATGQSDIMDMVALHSQEDYESLELGKWGIPTPASSSLNQRQNCFGGMGLSNGKEKAAEIGDKKSGLDLIVVPGMAFDRTLSRLGHGKGYYDMFFSRTRDFTQDGRMPALIALALQEQLLPPGSLVPTSESDWRVDGLITGDGRLLRLDAVVS